MKKILVADDEELIRRLVSDFLVQDHGDQVDDPHDAEEVAGDNLEHTDDNAGGVTARDAIQRTIHVVNDHEDELDNKVKTRKGFSEFCHSEISFQICTRILYMVVFRDARKYLCQKHKNFSKK